MGDRREVAEPTLATDQNQVDALCAEIADAGCLAFDTEFVMEDRYESEVCLIQVATPSATYIIDPFLDLDLSGIWATMADPDVEIVVHAGQEDLALSVQHTGKQPIRIFDVQIAAGFAGYDYPISLQRLVQATLHIRLHKSKTLTDWRRRPLTDAQIRYAAEDVAHLLRIHRKLIGRLEGRNRLDWVHQECSRFENMALYKPAEEDRFWRIKGAGSLKGVQLAALQALIDWRDGFARRVNRPARVVFKDYLLVEIAKHRIVDPEEIRDLRGVNVSKRDLDSIAKAVETALATPAEQWPKPKPHDHETPREASLVALAAAILRSYCLENDLAYPLLATQRSVRQFVRFHQGEGTDRSTVELLNGWRGAAIGAMLDEVFAGTRMVGVDHIDGEWRVHISPAKD